MGCLSANITSLHQPLKSSIRRIAQPLVARVQLCKSDLKCNVSLIDQRLQARIGLVCSAAVTSDFVQWSKDVVVFTNDDLGTVKVAYLSASTDWRFIQI